MPQRQSFRHSKAFECEKHQKIFQYICTSPECGHFRELCDLCKKDDSQHSTIHQKKDTAYEQVRNEIETVFKGLKVLRKKILNTMDTKLNNHNGLQQIQQKLESIKRTLNSKIDNFHSQLRRSYHKNIQEKLSRLFFIVEKSYEFLEEEKIRLHKNKRLKPFFLNDLGHDLRHYESYYEEILEKNVRKFKAGFEEDKVLKLMVTFEQNLGEIFKFNTPFEVLHEPHLLFVHLKGHTLYKFRNGIPIKQDIQVLGKNPLEKPEVGTLPSVYFSPTDTYYIFGDFKKQSNRIRRLQLGSQDVKNIQIKLQTKRVNFSACLFKDEIFIVGGENQKEGCLIKCQKFVPSEGKTYIVNSLNQRSSQHTLCNYRNKFILKVGGTDIVSTMSGRQASIVNPEIYLAQTEDWKIIQLPSPGPKKMRINFGLWPCAMMSESTQKIIILQGKCDFSSQHVKQRYDMTIETSEKDIKQIKMDKSIVITQPRFQELLDLYHEIQEENRFLVAIYDSEKGSIVYHSFNGSYPSKKD